MNPTPHQKNIVYGTINANGNVHIGDIIYNIERDFKSGSILFLRLDKKDETRYEAQLSVKSKHSTQGTLATSGEKWCENIEVHTPPQLFEALNEFQTFRRGMDTQMRLTGLRDLNASNVIAFENQLAQLIYQTFFAGEIGKVCGDFIRLLEEQRIEELLLAISAEDAAIVNLPFEMVLPLLFPPKLGEAKKSLSINNFGLVRTKMTSLDTFKMQGDHAMAAPLKMLFITALPENLEERGKMLQIEEEQTRLIERIGDTKPQIVIEFLDNASLAELNKALHARQHDIVHISGHGAYQAAENKGVLYFENQDGDEEQVSGKALGETLRQHACVKLLMLSACETAIAGSEGGVAEQAAAFGVPSIVAMRFAVTDDGAKVFTTELYTQLANGSTLTRALGYAREALHQDIVQHREQSPQILHIAEWFTPVVYQNQSVGALIDKTQPYHLPDNFYPLSSFLKTKQSRLIGEGFIGRKRYLIQMRQAFRKGQHVCLHGLGGLGKTTLAEAFAHNYDNHSHATVIFRNGNQINEKHILDELLFYFEIAGDEVKDEKLRITFKNKLRQLKAQLDDPKTDVLDKLQLLIDNYLNGRKTILLFDNVEDVQTDEGGAYQRSIGSESLSAFLKHLCENTPTNCHILFTTRYKIENLPDVVEHLELDKMGYAEQYRLLNYSPILRGIPLQERDDVYKRLDGHPRGYEYLETLLKKDKTFSLQQIEQSKKEVFENLLLAKVYERLTEREKAIFQMVSVFIARTPLAALSAVSGENEADLLPVLQSLQDWSLCFLEKDGRFEVHRLTREWMAQNETPLVKVKEWALKAGVHFKNNQTWYESELALQYFEIAEAWEQFTRISFFLQNLYEKIGLNQRALVINQTVLNKNIDDKTNGDALYYNSLLLQKTGDYRKALIHLTKILEIDQKIGDKKREAITLIGISQIYKIRGDNDNALYYLKKSLVINYQIENSPGIAHSLNDIGQIYAVKGDNDTAMRYFEKSLAINQQIENRQGEANSLSDIGQIFAAEDDNDMALCFSEKSLAIYRQILNFDGEQKALNNIGQIYASKGENIKALQYLKKSLAISQQLSHRLDEGIILNNIGKIYYTVGENDKALHYWEQSLEISQQIGDINGMASTLHNLGSISFKMNDFERAALYFIQAYQIFLKIGSPNVKVTKGYLDAIKVRIGEAKFQEILSKMG